MSNGRTRLACYTVLLVGLLAPLVAPATLNAQSFDFVGDSTWKKDVFGIWNVSTTVEWANYPNAYGLKFTYKVKNKTPESVTHTITGKTKFTDTYGSAIFTAGAEITIEARILDPFGQVIAGPISRKSTVK